MRILLLLSTLGLLACLFFHAAGWAEVDAQDRYPYFWAPALGLFVVWIPLVILQNEVTPAPGEPRDANLMFAFAPACVKEYIQKALLAYGFVSFIAFAVLRGCDSAPTRQMDGTYTVSRQRVRRAISEQTYHRMRKSEVLLLTAWVAMFYGVATVAFTSELIRRRRLEEQPSSFQKS